MRLTCKLCGKKIEIAGELSEGQHVRCPFCNEKFSYVVQREGISEEDLRTALALCRKDPELNGYYRNAPNGARLYIALEFYGKVFKDELDKEAYVKAFNEVGVELKERDLRYLLQYENDVSMREYLLDQLAARVGQSENSLRNEDGRGPENLGQEGLVCDPSGKHERNRKIVNASVCAAIVCSVLIVGWVSYLACWSNRGYEQVEHQSVRKAPAVEDFNSDPVKDVRQSRAVDSVQMPLSEAKPDAKPQMKEVDDRQKTMDAFRVYLEQEKRSLSNIVVESTVAYDEIIADQRRLSGALNEIDRENALRANRAITNGWIRYEKPEVVMMILKHNVINELAVKYIGEDFSAMCNSCRSKVKSIMQMHQEEEKLLEENRQKYQQAVQGDDERVKHKLEKADEMRMKFNRDIDRGVSERKAQLASKREILEQLKSHQPQTNTIMSERIVVEAEIVRLQKEIADYEKFAESGKASAAHVAATYAESAARKRADHAVSERQDNDNAVRMKLEHEKDLFAIAMEYEGRSIDRISSAMQARREILSTRMTDAKMKLDAINRTSLNADFLTDAQLKSIREKVGTKIENRLLNNLK